MKLSPAAGHPYQALAADVVTRIERGELKPEDRLDPVRKLASDYGVTMATAQRAVQQLVIDGYVKTVPGLGSFILEPPASGTRAGAVNVEVLSRRLEDLEAIVSTLAERLQQIEDRGLPE